MKPATRWLWLIGGLSFIHITPRLIWNASASVPLGLYWVKRPTGLEVGDERLTLLLPLTD